jgi:hypothetical protein
MREGREGKKVREGRKVREEESMGWRRRRRKGKGWG